jgi:hypothetical protein
VSSELLERRFAAIGASLKVAEGPWLGAPRIDVRADGRREHFSLAFSGVGERADALVVDVAPADRHLLLLVRSAGEKSKFLCGHDERHWFVAAVPEKVSGVTGVKTAMAALQPPVVARAATQVRRKRRFDRRNPAYIRQGEWFFLPVPGLKVDDRWILRDEPLARPGGTPHVLREAFRRGGTAVYVRPGGRMISEAEYRRLSDKQRRGGNWNRMTRDPELYARGSVRHPDHATIELRGWHRVHMNTENGALAMRHVAFLD